MIIRSGTKNRHAVATGLAVGALAVVAGAVWMFWPAGERRASQLVCAQMTHDFGVVLAREARDLRYEFVFKNQGPKTVRIVKAQPSCGCTTVDLADTVVGPGQSISIPLKVNWGDRDGVESARVDVETDEANGPTISLVIKGRVENPLSVWPRELDFGELGPGLSAAKTFDIGWRGDRPFAVREIKTGPDVVVERVSPAGAGIAGPAGRLAVKLNAPRTEGMPYREIFVFTSASQTPLLVSIKARSTGAISVSPASVLFNAGKGGANPVELEVVTTSGEENAVDARIMPESASSGFRIETGRREIGPRSMTTKLRIQCLKSGASVQMARLRLSHAGDVKEVPVVVLSGGGQ